MEISEIERLLDIFRDAQVSELTISVGNPPTTIKLRKPATIAVPEKHQRKAETTCEKSVKPDDAPPAKGAVAKEIFISAQMVGIFHSLDSIAAVGESITTGQVVGVIESMKLMNDVISDHDGVISEILVEDGMPVEYGHRLFKLSVA